MWTSASSSDIKYDPLLWDAANQQAEILLSHDGKLTDHPNGNPKYFQ